MFIEMTTLLYSTFQLNVLLIARQVKFLYAMQTYFLSAREVSQASSKFISKSR